ncbi:hypothetical protein LAZ67_X002020 [Cordylochernes scorpioides]|uniref:Reverse transcriptase domain-containing protein n=1 Tax=Cordylochernes scorpioides TaxID=51811 RepID=A0ABY6LT28_9ARAC|nr:hypothetical protein LAZ67_X002020 [Cordylochernes scorpioides]
MVSYSMTDCCDEADCLGLHQQFNWTSQSLALHGNVARLDGLSTSKDQSLNVLVRELQKQENEWTTDNIEKDHPYQLWGTDKGIIWGALKIDHKRLLLLKDAVKTILQCTICLTKEALPDHLLECMGASRQDPYIPTLPRWIRSFSMNSALKGTSPEGWLSKLLMVRKIEPGHEAHSCVLSSSDVVYELQKDLGGAYGFWNNSIENIMNNMVNQIKSAMVQNGMQIEIKANNSLSKPWFDHECYIAKKIMKATLTKYIKSNKDLDRLEYVKTRNKYTSIINNKKKKYFREIQEKLNNTYDSSEFWKTIARFRKRNYTQGNISISDWQQFYNKLLDTESIPDYEPVTMTFLNTDNELTKCITLNEISKEISRIRHGKAAGFDDIMNEAIKALPKNYLISLKDIFNRILRTSEFPTTWLKSVIQPIFKNGDPDDPSNYRGIALLSNLAKLFTSILKSRLGSCIERRNIVPENQAGFRAGHSCQDHLFTLLYLIQMTLSGKRRKCYMFFVDLKTTQCPTHYYGENW